MRAVFSRPETSSSFHFKLKDEAAIAKLASRKIYV
jgi:hypothetical protein